MTDLPRHVLSEQFQAHMAGKRVLHAVFTTFQFDPSFFEQEVLPVFLDINLSHAVPIKLLQLEACLAMMPGGVAVYYDANGLVASDGSAKLDVRRIPVRHKTGIFHPKNVFILAEAVEPDSRGHHVRSLLVAAMSANLTRPGWWINVEVCHIDELRADQPTAMREGLLEFLVALKRRSPGETEHTALEAIHAFVLACEQSARRKNEARLLRPHFYGGDRPFDEYLADITGTDLREMCLEVISPYFDKDAESEPLARLLRRFRPSETRVFLPRNDAGDGLCESALYDWVREQPGVAWGRLPKDLLRMGKSEDVKNRRVHAKVYRFFARHPKREVLVVGSVNLTRPAHQAGGNFESAIVIEIDPPRRPEFWLELDPRRPAAFGLEEQLDPDTAASTAGSRLAIRYSWDRATAEAYWDDATSAPELHLEANGQALFSIPSLAARVWSVLPGAEAGRLARILESTSFLRVVGDRAEPTTILVEELGMWKKPPLLSQLPIRDILKYWSLLSADQRAEFLADRATELLPHLGVSDLVTPTRTTSQVDSIFDRFAGVFHAFDCLRAAVRRALDADNEKDALHRLFGTKYDSLGSLLARVEEDEVGDLVDHYVLVLCARQLCSELRRGYPEFWKTHRDQVADLERSLAVGDRLRARFAGDLDDFLTWFEPWFLDRARAVEPAS